ncbi:DnaJ domain containing protein [Ophiocordyceps sinensis CO18]|uniref:DnaJ domain containing protein n=1 Tax=Ophiocordyceps sinensis (strain Co18 / CGMCC 3.14243) TaxID=911162 RepID=T5ABB4_OPHSC|nr:DnaJ domain containing protein [Ophiocordyceps sinensis CO18]
MLIHGLSLLLVVALVGLVTCAEDYYNVLGIGKDASDKELKSAYRRLSKKHHPDKNPYDFPSCISNDKESHDKFVEVADAYSVLSDSELRQVYDRYGHDGVKSHRQGGGGGGNQQDPFDLFSRFFGGHGHFGTTSREPRGHNVEGRVEGDDLYWTEVLSLREAWMGDWSRNLTHLDAHVVRLGRPRRQVVHPGHVETVAGEGMPLYLENGEDGDELKFGNLFVTYEVVLPDQMDSAMEKDFWALWEKWRAKKGVDLQKDSGRPDPPPPSPRRDEL